MKRHILILAACACACASAGVMSARLGALGRNDTVVTNVTDMTPGDYEAVSNRAMFAVTTNAHGVAGTVAGMTFSMYPDAAPYNIQLHASNLDEFTIYIYGPNKRYLFSPLYTVSDDDVMRRVDVAGAMSVKQDALPYPTNAIPYAAISGAPSGGGQEWHVVDVALDMPSSIRFVTNGCVVASFGQGAYLNYSRWAWPDGAAMFVRLIDVPQSYEPYCPEQDSALRLVGYGTWPTNNFQSVWWRSGTNIFVNILLEE